MSGPAKEVYIAWNDRGQVVWFGEAPPTTGHPVHKYILAPSPKPAKKRAGR